MLAACGKLIGIEPLASDRDGGSPDGSGPADAKFHPVDARVQPDVRIDHGPDARVFDAAPRVDSIPRAPDAGLVLVTVHTDAGRRKISSNPDVPWTCVADGTCTAMVTLDAPLTVTVIPPDQTVDVWTTGCTPQPDLVSCSLTVLPGTDLHVSFSPARSLTVVPHGTGSVTSDVFGIDCGAICSVGAKTNDQVTLTAHPVSGGAFAGWRGGGCGSGPTCTVMVAAADVQNRIDATFFAGTPGGVSTSDGVTDVVRGVADEDGELLVAGGFDTGGFGGTWNFYGRSLSGDGGEDGFLIGPTTLFQSHDAGSDEVEAVFVDTSRTEVWVAWTTPAGAFVSHLSANGGEYGNFPIGQSAGVHPHAIFGSPTLMWVAGSFSGTVNFADPGQPVENTTAMGAQDGFIAGYDVTGATPVRKKLFFVPTASGEDDYTGIGYLPLSQKLVAVGTYGGSPGSSGFLETIDPAGVTTVFSMFGGAGDHATGVAVQPGGLQDDVFVSANLGPGQFTFAGDTTFGTKATGALLHYTANNQGNAQPRDVARFASTMDVSTANGVAVTPGLVAVTGAATGDLDIGLGFTTMTGERAYLAVFRPDLTPVWLGSNDLGPNMDEGIGVVYSGTGFGVAGRTGVHAFVELFAQ
jgi:hypothetical protein